MSEPDDKAMLEFLLSQFIMHSPKMDGSHSWRFTMGWPWRYAVGKTARDAVLNAMAEVEREKSNNKGAK